MNNKERKGRIILGILFLSVLLRIAGCRNNLEKKTEDSPESYNEQSINAEEIEKFLEICQEIYENSFVENSMDDLKIVQNIVNELGGYGYTVIDSENQINMWNADKLMQFCESVEEEKEAQTTVLEVSYDGRIVKYDFAANSGRVMVTGEFFSYHDGNMECTGKRVYPAYSWEYTGEGYLFFEEYHMSGYDGPSGHIAFRVQPLDEFCRELNRQYIRPIGYGGNNLFLSDWSEEDFGSVNFYDVFDIFYPITYEQESPYIADEDLSIGTIYRISEIEFENTIMSYFKISSETLRDRTTYFPEDHTYEYRPRGLYDCQTPSIPYSEVIDYVENADGTMKLTVQAVYPDKNVSKVFTHEVVIRPLNDGGVQYVSNHIVSPEEDFEETWYVERLTEEEWESVYEESFVRTLSKEDEIFISEDEKEWLKSSVLSAANIVKSVYRNIKIAKGPFYASNIEEFSEEQCKEVVFLLGENGYASIADNCNMENYELVETFYSLYQDRKDAQVTVFEVKPDGMIGAVTFVYRKGKLQTCYIEIGWQEGGVPEIRDTYVNDVSEIKLTKKGYFIYSYETVLAHASLRQFWRIKPLSEECRELTKKYISGLSYVNYNMLVTDWDKNNVEKILMPCMFEDIYYIYTGENLKVEGDSIPAELYEKIMLTYFPVSGEQLRTCCGYDVVTNSYKYEMIFAKPYPPFGEVIDYTKYADGKILLIVDGVWPDNNSDCAFTNKILVQTFNDGTFKYLSNSIEQKEMEIPIIEQ